MITLYDFEAYIEEIGTMGNDHIDSLSPVFFPVRLFRLRLEYLRILRCYRLINKNNEPYILKNFYEILDIFNTSYDGCWYEKEISLNDEMGELIVKECQITIKNANKALPEIHKLARQYMHKYKRDKNVCREIREAVGRFEELFIKEPKQIMGDIA